MAIFKKIVAILKEEMGCQKNCSDEVQSVPVPDIAITIREDEISRVIKDIEDPSDGSLRIKALQNYTSIGEHFYQKACQLEGKIQCFETCIRRPFFHVKPLDENQLRNWHHYLDFIENQEDFDWVRPNSLWFMWKFA
ncbi:unnamed protein product [Ilex paraguariensis]|uniref:Uncharacterized protein n=1 Tax=Ilex paraguariensis TaxID=185542 RepID=A0ABC8R2Q8_9AQUA